MPESVHQFQEGAFEAVREHPETAEARRLSLSLRTTLSAVLNPHLTLGGRGRAPMLLHANFQQNDRGIPSDPSLLTEVIYLPDLVPGTKGAINIADFYNTYRKGHELLQGLPSVEGVTWGLGSAAEVVTILDQHFRDTDGEILLQDGLTVTRDRTFDYTAHRVSKHMGNRLAVGNSSNFRGMELLAYTQTTTPKGLGVFAIGFPAQIAVKGGYNLTGESY